MKLTRELLIDSLQELVEIETPSGDLESLERGFQTLLDLVLKYTGRQAVIDRVDGVPYLYLAPMASPSVLIVGHLDTVWPVGTLSEIPFAVRGDIVTGPGVFDMKAGLIIALAALANCAVPANAGLLVTGDEEIGSPTGRLLIEKYAPLAAAVLVPEPAAPGGGIKNARKGVGLYKFTITGLEAHAGLEPERGANTTVEMAALISDLVGLQDASDGTTVTPTKAMSGVTANTVPAEATLHVDVRAWTEPELTRIDDAVRGRQVHVAGVTVTVSGGINRLPLEEKLTAELVHIAQEIALEVGMGRVETAAVGGASDGNFCASVGVPTLDGVGACGGGAHARDEWLDIDSVGLRGTWLARIIERVVQQSALTI